MRSIGLYALPALALAGLGCAGQPASHGTLYTHGRWFDGHQFEQAEIYVIDGLLRRGAPAQLDATIDLQGGYIVPPFAEAHNHNVESSRFDKVNALYMEQGIFYVKNPNSLGRFTDPLRDRLGGPGTIDAVFAGGGLTCEGGHPVEIADRMIKAGRWTTADGDGGFYWTIDSQAELDDRWETFLASKPDFVKLYLLYSEDQAARLADPNTYGWRGLDPGLVAPIVARAHAAGLRVSAHVETGSDFHTAVAAGVDEVNHMPGFRPLSKPLERYQISDADAQLAASRRTVVVTTVGELVEYTEPGASGPVPPEAAPKVRELLQRNLSTLRRAGVNLAVGSDRYEKTSLSEALALNSLALFEPAELLTMWCETTAQTIFPQRKIGRLSDGYEASFLVLAGDPLEDFSNVTKITRRVKRGVQVDLSRDQTPG